MDDIELLQNWLTRHRQTEMNYDCNPTRYECQIFEAIEHIICENAQYSEHNMKLEQALVDTDRELREYKKALELACEYVECDFNGISGVGGRIKYFKDKAKEMLKDENKETC